MTASRWGLGVSGVVLAVCEFIMSASARPKQARGERLGKTDFPIVKLNGSVQKGSRPSRVASVQQTRWVQSGGFCACGLPTQDTQPVILPLTLLRGLASRAISEQFPTIHKTMQPLRGAIRRRARGWLWGIPQSRQM